MTPPPKEDDEQGAGIWPYVPVALLVATLAGLGFMMRLATNDPQFAVERDYYKKALDWDQTQAQAERNRKLGWQVSLSTEGNAESTELRVTIRDAKGAVVPATRVRVEAFSNLAAGARTDLELGRVADGAFSARIEPKHFGLWEFRFVVEAPGGPFTQILRQDLKPGGAT
ncbi:MAG: FixH family protein [Polyangiaceae bacterium]